jgi:hypothetical protein
VYAVLTWYLRHKPEVVRVQDVGLVQTPDPDILEWAASQGRVLLSHDVSTVPPAANCNESSHAALVRVPGYLSPRER